MGKIPTFSRLFFWGPSLTKVGTRRPASLECVGHRATVDRLLPGWNCFFRFMFLARTSTMSPLSPRMSPLQDSMKGWLRFADVFIFSFSGEHRRWNPTIRRWHGPSKWGKCGCTQHTQTYNESIWHNLWSASSYESDQEDDNGIFNGGFDKEKKREKNKRKNTSPSAGGLPVVSLRNSSHQQRWIHFCTLFWKTFIGSFHQK